MARKSSIASVISVTIFFGVISIVIVDLLFYLVFPSAWFFLLMPFIMGFGIKKFAKFPKERLNDEEEFDKLSKRMGILCGAICLFAVLIGILPILIISGEQIILHLLTNFVFYLVCALSIYFGYTKGIEIVTDAYYDSAE